MYTCTFKCQQKFTHEEENMSVKHEKTGACGKQRRFSHRLANKNSKEHSFKQETLEQPDIQGDAVKPDLKVPAIETYNHEKKTNRKNTNHLSHDDSRSKAFLDTLELQPVETERSSSAARKGADNLENAELKFQVSDKLASSAERQIVCPHASELNDTNEAVGGCVEHDEKLAEHTSEHEAQSVVSPKPVTWEVRIVESATSGEQLKETGHTTSDDSKRADSTNRTRNLESKKVYMFRDVNRVAHGLNEAETPDMFETVDLNRHGKKRRYDKLMKKLVDGEKTLEVNLKEVENENMKKANCRIGLEKFKEKIQIREKKKYEYLINYMRNQWKVEQESFQDLLPQKVELVKKNVARQLEACTDKLIREKRKRGRPRKVVVEGDNEVNDSCTNTNGPVKCYKSKEQQNKKPHDKKTYPLKFPKSLLLETSSCHTKQKADIFRVGIVDKNGCQEFIELSGQTLQGAGGLHSVADAVGCSRGAKFDNGHQDTKEKKRTYYAEFEETTVTVSSTTTNKENCSPDMNEASRKVTPVLIDKLAGGDQFEPIGKCPPTTISLPSVTSLERDYELVSLSPSSPPQFGSFHKDQFFIPQSTFDQDGKTSMIIVGPFCLVCDPRPHLQLVSSGDPMKGPAMILRKKIHSPSNTPPRDFRINKICRGARGSKKLAPETAAGVQQVDPSSVLVDHSYMTPPQLRDTVKRYCKALAKHSANVQFIDARVENITEGGGDNILVTIKGNNILHHVKNSSGFSQKPIQRNKDGMPVAYTLSQITTSFLVRADLAAQRERLAQESRESGDYSPVIFPLAAMGDVVMEVIIPPGGTELPCHFNSRHRYQPCSEEMEEDAAKPGMESMNDADSLSFPINGSVINKEEQGYVEETLTPVVHTSVDHVEVEQPSEASVVVENADAVDSASPPGLPCCRMCLHLFANDYLLFAHVRSHHPTSDQSESVYLEELRARSHLSCPICVNPPLLLPTAAKLKRHLKVSHGLEGHLETCRVCQAEFVDKQDLERHIELAHNNMTGRRLVSLLNPQQAGNLTRGQRIVPLDYLSCNRCNVVFNDCVSLLSHTLKVHPELNQFNMCRLCDRLFDSNLSLHKHLKKAHEQTHDGAVRCPFCPAWLSSVELASIHRITLHTGAVPVHCPFCGAGYQSLHYMYNHVRNQHLQTDVHICPDCQVSLPSSRLLSDHIRKAHFMNSCIMKDGSLSLGNMTYCCPFCTMSLMRTYDLAIHVIHAHKEHLLPSQCQFCLQSFVSDGIMKIHMAGAHGVNLHQAANGGGFLHDRFEDRSAVTVILNENGSTLYSHNKELDRVEDGNIRRHLIKTPEMMDPQASNEYQGMDEQETIVYLSDGNHVVGSGDMYGDCSTMEDVRLLREANENFHLHGVDYLETLTNDSIAVGADVVADVSMEEIAITGSSPHVGQEVRNQDMIGMSHQFEIDGVLYELASSQDCSDTHLTAVSDMASLDTSDLQFSYATDLAQLLGQQEK